MATAICQMRDPAAPNDCISSKLKLSGIGKYPFIRTKASDLDFGTVITGKEAHQTLVLENKSLVTARFSVQKTDADLEVLLQAPLRRLAWLLHKCCSVRTRARTQTEEACV